MNLYSKTNKTKGTLLTELTNVDSLLSIDYQALIMPRQARLDSPGTLHHVIIRGIEKKPIVKDDVDRQAFIDRMGRLASESQTAV